mmetsp:Transcript_4019/g.11229  ORF Transcript_4019/g.11229 Transcript_4019/m.11229 type:complete len:242 (+) Transcript_4019:1364-2089(+)
MLFLGNTTLVAVGSPSAPGALAQEKLTLYGKASCTSNSRTLNTGESMAHCRAQPRLTTSDAFSVRLGSLPKNPVSALKMAGTRAPQPTSSTEARSSRVRPASVSTAWQGERMSCRRSEHMASKSSRVILPRTSLSSIKHSSATGASLLMDSTFLALVSSFLSLRDARAWVFTSILNLSLNSAAKCSKSFSSKFLPPSLWSHAWASTFSCPFLKATAQICSAQCPTSTKTTFSGLSSGRSVL